MRSPNHPLRAPVSPGLLDLERRADLRSRLALCIQRRLNLLERCPGLGIGLDGRVQLVE